ncbi:hypothetical protein [Sphingomonas solaris]|uniref:Uncharacterized protein n=1 Tax=Alterirhizorhabdus solaris TaxID=2529389 RepID=A0A558RCA4_9SPHN|nr:hypothetical protein [Sphingomonas solaris]TVV76970.1 hypothetical protein FOY91_02705 [Sphingomonas solaris]
MGEAGSEHVHPDHWSSKHRELIAHLRAQHLPGVDTDDEALAAGTVEQARLLLVTAGGLLGLTLTKLLDLDRSVCAAPIYVEVAALSIALLLGWFGLLIGLKMRAQRVDRRYDIYNAHIDAHMLAAKHQQAIDLTTFDRVYDSAFNPERASRRLIGRLRFWAALLTSLGISMAAVAVIGTISPDRCLGGSHIGGIVPNDKGGADVR